MSRLVGAAEPLAGISRVQTLAAVKRIVAAADVATAVRRCGKDRVYYKRLPPALVVWFVIGMGLFFGDTYRQVYRWLVPGEVGGADDRDPIPLRSTLCEARRRLGLKMPVYLCRRVVKLLAEATPTPGAFYRGMRLMALDGFVLDVADSAANDLAFGRPGSGRGRSAFPQVRVLALVEAGTHVFWKWAIKRCKVGESSMTPGLLKHLLPDMLLMWDRNFFKYAHVKTVLGKRANLLARVKVGLILEPIKYLPDKSVLAKIYRNAYDRKRDRNGVVVRVIEYTLNDPARTGCGEKHRLLTTLLDAKTHPAGELIELYHVRWEQELAIDELKTHQMTRPLLRSRTPAGVFQEVHGLLLAHYVVRSIMYQAAVARGVEPTRIGFVAAIKILRLRLAQFPKSRPKQKRWWEDLLVEVGREVNPPRRDRINPRVVKRKMSKWKKKRPIHASPPQPKKSFAKSVVILN